MQSRPALHGCEELQVPPSSPGEGFWHVPSFGGNGMPSAPGGGPDEVLVFEGTGMPSAPGGGAVDFCLQRSPVLHAFCALHAAPSSPAFFFLISSSEGEPLPSSEVPSSSPPVHAMSAMGPSVAREKKATARTEERMGKSPFETGGRGVRLQDKCL